MGRTYFHPQKEKGLTRNKKSMEKKDEKGAGFALQGEGGKRNAKLRHLARPSHTPRRHLEGQGREGGGGGREKGLLLWRSELP